MRLGNFFLSGVLFAFLLTSCQQVDDKNNVDIIFLHHSTGEVIMNGNTDIKSNAITLPGLFKSYNKEHKKKYSFKETDFPKSEPYGWKNYPYDYYNIWVKNAGDQPFLTEPTLELLTKDYEVVIFKHCFPVSNIQPDELSPDIESELRSTANYQLQYEALRDKLHEFPDVKFIVFTGAVQVKANITEEEALRAKSFFMWVKEDWDQPDDNIYLWDLYELQTEGGIYFKDEYARKVTNSHPGPEFAGKAVGLLFNRIIDVIENNGAETSLTGELH
ncbi:MAG: hypothetical protein GX625_08810 [Clostridiaceae bacterium]|nr:hypothetical protein [Clostridiaceae bacterium]